MYNGNMYEYVERRAMDLGWHMYLTKDEGRYKIAAQFPGYGFGQPVTDSEDFEGQVEKFIKWVKEFIANPSIRLIPADEWELKLAWYGYV